MNEAVIHKSLHRHDLVMGGERDLVLLAGLVAFMVLVGGSSWPSTLCAGLWWLGTSMTLRRMARVDPMMSKVWTRFARQQDYYPARATPWQRTARVRR